MNERVKRGAVLTAKHIAYIAVMTALLIGGQVALGFAAGIEVVTVLLACFSFTFGITSGVLCAVAFSLLRCFIWGFYPTVIALYLIYYPLFALLFGCLGKIKDDAFEQPKWHTVILVNLLLLAVVAAGASSFIFHVIRISKRYRVILYSLIGISMGLCALMCVVYDLFYAWQRKGKNYGKLLKLIFLTAVATVCTICFTLIDDVLTPLMMSMDKDATLAYFFTSFTAMLPQSVCTIVTMSTLFYPLTKVMRSVRL